MSGKKQRKRKPPPRWRRHLVQAELELPPPLASSQSSPGASDSDGTDAFVPDPEWWQKPVVVGGLATLAATSLVATGIALFSAHRERAVAAAAEVRATALTMRAITTERALRIAPNPRSWSATPDASIRWPEPPELLDLYLPVAYSQFNTFAITIDKVNAGRVLIVQRMVPDSNRDLRLSLNSSSFGPGEYRIRLQGYTWRGERVDAGWVRLVVG